MVSIEMTGGTKMRILVVEDEIDLCDSIAEGLQIDGYAVDTCYDGEDAFELIITETYDLVILDLNLPGMDAIDILTNLRNQNKNCKVLILSARGSVYDKVLGLDTVKRTALVTKIGEGYFLCGGNKTC